MPFLFYNLGNFNQISQNVSLNLILNEFVKWKDFPFEKYGNKLF